MDSLPPPVFGVPLAVVQAPGDVVRLVKVYVFGCPLCGNEFRYDDRYEPICTGPSWRDEHPPEVMRLRRVESRRAQVEIVSWKDVRHDPK